jgi:hypothetical protein
MAKQARFPVRRGIAALACATALLAPHAARAQEEVDRTNVLLILDSSGSMAGKIGGQTKMQLAEGVVRELVGNMPADMRVGLLVYGARSPREQKDCEDIQLLVPVQPTDPAAFDSALGEVRPRGMTPIANSLRQGAAALRGVPGKSTIVLVSDGKDTCENDPCATAREVHATTGIDVKVHVVGFDVGADERNTLECVAAGGGGNYYAAENEEQLRSALTEATKRPPPCRGQGPMWASIAHPGLGEMMNSGQGWSGLPARKFWLGFIPGFGWPGYLQVVSAIDASRCRTNDWPR